VNGRASGALTKGYSDDNSSAEVLGPGVLARTLSGGPGRLQPKESTCSSSWHACRV